MLNAQPVESISDLTNPVDPNPLVYQIVSIKHPS